MLHETIEIDCDKEQLEKFNNLLGNEKIIYIKVRDTEDRLELLDWSDDPMRWC